ncbi:MAG: hypothetical protein JWN95_3997 [Frankiales bacterium]|nr:hypothetical protein [Frankiales bacterium]
MADLGLTATAAYVCGRAAVLGDTSAAVVVATFAWFEPGLITGAYVAGMNGLLARVIDDARSAATGASLRQVLGDEDPTAISDILSDAVAAAEPSGRPLFAARRASHDSNEGRPSDPFERLWWACETLRDHRGDSHTAAVLAAGIGPAEMNVLTELAVGMPLRSYTRTRGWTDEHIDAAIDRLAERGWLAGTELTDAGHQARSELEAQTDRQDERIVQAIGTRLPQVCAQLAAWGSLCIQAKLFPDDALKRAAG